MPQYETVLRRKSRNFLMSMTTNEPRLTGKLAENAERYVRRHNATIDECRRRTAQPAEQGIYDLVKGIDSWIASNPDSALPADGYTEEYIIRPMLDAVANALNFDIGRLDPSVFSDWVVDIATKCEMEGY